MSVSEFRAAMGRCHRRTDLMCLFNGCWHEVAGTFAEFTELRMEFAARLDQLTEDAAPEGSRGGIGQIPELEAA